MTQDTGEKTGSQSRRGTGYRVGDLVVDLAGGRVLRDDQEIALPRLSFDLLAALIRRAPGLVSVRDLMDEVWPGLVVGPETVSQRIKLIRAALDDDAEHPRYIAGVRGRGYRVVATVEPVPHSPTVAATQPPRLQAAVGPPRAFRRPAALAAVVVFIGVVAVSIWLTFPGTDEPEPATTAQGGTARVAVLPLDNLSPAPADAFFADGLHEEIITTLASQSPNLEVISRTTMLSLRSRPAQSVTEIGSAVGATHVIEGSVRREAEQVRLTLQLIDVRSDSHVWAKSYDRTLVSALTLQSEVAGDVAAQLAVRLQTGSPVPVQRTRDPLAYDLYLKALLARSAAATVDVSTPVQALDAVEEPLSEAIARDPEFAAAYAERVGVRLTSFWYNVAGGEGQVPNALRDLEAAERLAPRDPKVLAARAMYLGHVELDYAGAVAAFDAAEAAGLADPQWLVSKVFATFALGHGEDALRIAERCLSLDPRNPGFVIMYTGLLETFNRPVEAVATLDDAIARMPEAATVLRIQRAAVVYRHTGRIEELNALLAPYVRDAMAASRIGVDTDMMLVANAEIARFNGRFDEMKRSLAALSVPVVRGTAGFGMGQQPVARLRGWANLLVGDTAAAAADGREVLRFLEANEGRPWNAHYRELMAAEAYTFIGERDKALAAAGEALQTPLTVYTAAALRTIAAVYAWNGAHDEAVRLLDALTTNALGVAPADVVHDPLLTVPLAGSAAYATLAARLRQRMQATASQLP